VPEEVVRGHSLEEIRREWAQKLKLLPDNITLEVMDEPGLFSKEWKVRLIWTDQTLQAPFLSASQAIWDETKYDFILGEGVKQFIPFVKGRLGLMV